MRKVKEVLRLKHQHGLSARKIARSCGLSRSTVADYLMRAEAAGLIWPLAEGESDTAIEARLFPSSGAGTQNNQRRPLPDFAEIHQELQSRKDLTLQLVWLEYKESRRRRFPSVSPI